MRCAVTKNMDGVKRRTGRRKEAAAAEKAEAQTKDAEATVDESAIALPVMKKPAGVRPRQVVAGSPGRVASADSEGVQISGPATETPVPEEIPAPGAASQPDEEPVEEVDFEMLLGESMSVERTFEPGTKVSGTVEVVSLHGQEVFLDLGGKANGYMLKEELLDDEGNLTVKQGDVVEGVVAGTDYNGIRVVRMMSMQSADIDGVRDAQAAGLPVEGTVTATNKGGYEVRLGRVQAFCPFSQIDLYRPADPEALVGQVYKFRVTEVKGSRVVVSRAALLREDRAQNAEAVREKLEVGARMTGVVRSIQKFGVFVDLGGIDGLVHLSELSWSRVEDPHTCVTLGQQVEVVVTEIDTKRDRIGLSLRRASADPVIETFESIGIGSVLSGVVARLTDFGAFITIAPGVDGMVHISEMAHHRIRHPRDLLTVGDDVQVKVVDMDVERRRIGLNLKSLVADPWDSAATRFSVGQTVSGTVASIQDFGVFVDLEAGVTALLPASETGVPRGKSLGTAFKVGKEVELQVLRVDVADRKMALTTRPSGEIDADVPQPSRGSSQRPSRSGGPDRSDRAPRGGQARVWMDREVSAPKEEEAPVGSLGAALMAALSKKDES